MEAGPASFQSWLGAAAASAPVDGLPINSIEVIEPAASNDLEAFSMSAPAVDNHQYRNTLVLDGQVMNIRDWGSQLQKGVLDRQLWSDSPFHTRKK